MIPLKYDEYDEYSVLSSLEERFGRHHKELSSTSLNNNEQQQHLIAAPHGTLCRALAILGMSRSCAR